jgi:Zn-dependent M16 (insulinase) family peptidase
VALRPVFVSSTSALTENTAWTARLINEVLLETNFADTARIRDILAQRRLGLEQYFATAGHSAALARVGSYYSPAGVMRQQLGGVDFYFFVKDLLNHFEERAEALSETLANLAQRLFAPGAEVISFTGSNEDLACFVETSREQGVQLGRARGTETTNLIVPAPEAKNEAFVVPADVVYVATGYDRSLLGVPYSGSWLLATRVLSYDYLWNEVRVKGGAYGAGFQTTRPGSSRFYSYRDPRIDETIERFKGAGSWLAGVFNPTADEMDGYVVSTVASLDSPEKARDIIRRQDGMYFGGITQADRARSRSQVIEATVADIQQLAPSIDAITGAGMSCVFGSRDIIEASNTGLTVIDLLAE